MILLTSGLAWKEMMACRANGVRSRRDWPFLIDLANQVASLIRCGQDCPLSVKVSDPD